MNPREIEVHIEELVVHGFDARGRWELGDALRDELHAFVVANGLPSGWLRNPAAIEIHPVSCFSLTNPGNAGREIGRAIHGGERP